MTVGVTRRRSAIRQLNWPGCRSSCRRAHPYVTAGAQRVCSAAAVIRACPLLLAGYPLPREAMADGVVVALSPPGLASAAHGDTVAGGQALAPSVGRGRWSKVRAAQLPPTKRAAATVAGGKALAAEAESEAEVSELQRSPSKGTPHQRATAQAKGKARGKANGQGKGQGKADDLC